MISLHMNYLWVRVIGGEYSGVTADIDADFCLAFQNITDCAGVLGKYRILFTYKRILLG